MSHTYYECHITMEGDPRIIQPIVDLLPPPWKFSQISGDIVLGDGVKCYATRHFNARLDQTIVKIDLFEVALWLENRGIKVTRRKIERVIFDDRSAKIQCNGGCLECHLDDLKS